jgi:hypothetical protein
MQVDFVARLHIQIRVGLAMVYLYLNLAREPLLSVDHVCVFLYDLECVVQNLDPDSTLALCEGV